jgi:hypothetical protein
MAKYWVVVLLIVFSLLPETLSAQCAMCKAVAESSSGNTAAKGLNTGILFLMFMPYLMMAVVAVTWYYYRKGKRV